VRRRGPAKDRKSELEVDLTLRRIVMRAADTAIAGEIVHRMTPHELVKAASRTLKHRARITRIGGGG
jgi:hypothetical protein